MKKIDAYYEDKYHSVRHHEMIVDDYYFRARADVQSRFYFTPAERTLRIFEYGCGVGQGLAGLPNASGWDISAEARDLCRQRKLNVYDDIAEVPREAWDIVFCRHVLEHLEQPLEALRQMRELLSRGGELYLVLPKEDHYPVMNIAPDVDQHLYCWNFRALNNLVFRSGLAPYRNDFRYSLGWRALLPVRRMLGAAAFFHLTHWGGQLLKRNGELVVRARLPAGGG
jgi:SAM-dependent methyltransferase